MMRALAILTLLLIGANANAQQTDNPIPVSGAAIIMKKTLPDPLEAGWKGEKVCELLFENEHTRVARCTFPPGVGHERHYHPPHYGYILQGGTMRITDADGTREQPTPDGASWWSPGVEWHEAVNIGDTTSVYLIFEPKSAVKNGGTR